MEKIIDVWSDNWKAREVIDILHDFGYETAGMHREVIGDFAENVEWSRCKTGELPAMCVSLIHDENTFIHGVDEIAEKPLFLYKLVLIVPDMPKGTEDTTEEEEDKEEEQGMKEEEKTENAVLNIGCTTKYGDVLNDENMIDFIGYYHDCTITKTIRFYKGKRENSLKVEVYGVSISDAVDYASFYARCFEQECIALTIKDTTVFVKGFMTDDEHNAMVAELKR